MEAPVRAGGRRRGAATPHLVARGVRARPGGVSHVAAFSLAGFLARSAAASAASAALAALALSTASAARFAALKGSMALIVRLTAFSTDGILPSLVHGIASMMMLPHAHMSPPKRAGASLMPMGTGRTGANVPTAIGVPDVSGDGLPDLRARMRSDGQTRIYSPSRTDTNPAVKIVLAVDWNTVKAFG